MKRLSTTRTLFSTHVCNGLISAWLVAATTALVFSYPLDAGAAQPDKTKARAQPAPAETPQKRQRVVSKLEGFELAGAASLNAEAIRLGATRKAEAAPLVALAPYLGKSLSPTPTFRWRAAKDVTQTKFVLEDARGKLYEAKVSGTAFTYPAIATPLERGKNYAWHIEGIIHEIDVAKSDLVRVQIVGAPEADAAQKKIDAAEGADEVARALARAQVFTDARVWYDAVDAYARLLAQFPDRADLYRQRGAIYAAIPATLPESNADFARAEKLAPKPRQD